MQPMTSAVAPVLMRQAVGVNDVTRLFCDDAGCDKTRFVPVHPALMVIDCGICRFKNDESLIPHTEFSLATKYVPHLHVRHHIEFTVRIAVPVMSFGVGSMKLTRFFPFRERINLILAPPHLAWASGT